ncbi:MAG: serine hydrolase domain-containing protein [Bacteroidota bacterium]
MKKLIVLMTCIAYLQSCSTQNDIPADLYPKTEDIQSIDDIVQPYMESEWTHGLSIGIYKDGEYQFYNYGQLSDENSSTPDSLSIYEIGSVTKVMTGALLNLMVEKSEVEFDASIGEYLPDNLGNWQGEQSITLEELSTHTSGFPRIPKNLLFTAITNGDNPYKNYEVEHLYKFLKKYEPTNRADRKCEYSNLSTGLLGHILALQADKTYEQLLEEEIFTPLAMTNSTITFEEEHLSRLAPGHNPAGNPTSNWDIPTLAGAGAVRSNTLDMLKFVEANIKGELSLEETHRERKQFDANHTIGLGWLTNISDPDFPITWHNGGTGGYRSYCGFVKEQEIGVVVLSNTAIGVDHIGYLILKYLGE